MRRQSKIQIVRDRTGSHVADRKKHFQLRYGSGEWQERFAAWLESNGIETYEARTPQRSFTRYQMKKVEGVSAPEIPQSELDGRRVTRSMSRFGKGYGRGKFWEFGTGVRI